MRVPNHLVARDLSEPCQPQTVADVLARNAVPLLVPCHRVVPEDRCCSTEYVFGAPAQQKLLAAEGLDAAAVERVIERGIRYIENDGWFCLPTCGNIASLIDTPGYVGLHSLSEARKTAFAPAKAVAPSPHEAGFGFWPNPWRLRLRRKPHGVCGCAASRMAFAADRKPHGVRVPTCGMNWFTRRCRTGAGRAEVR